MTNTTDKFDGKQTGHENMRLDDPGVNMKTIVQHHHSSGDDEVANKSSAEILTELFRSLNAEPPSISEDSTESVSDESDNGGDTDTVDKNSGTETKETLKDSSSSHKKKKSKKKHKHKKKHSKDRKRKDRNEGKKKHKDSKHDKVHISSQVADKESESTKDRSSSRSKNSESESDSVSDESDSKHGRHGKSKRKERRKHRSKHEEEGRKVPDSPTLPNKPVKRKSSSSPEVEFLSSKQAKVSTDCIPFLSSVQNEAKSVSARDAVNSDVAQSVTSAVNVVASDIPMPPSPCKKTPAQLACQQEGHSEKLPEKELNEHTAKTGEASTSQEAKLAPGSLATDNKSKSKIVIKNLKFSTVFQQTVKEVEEQARKKAEKFEEGEIIDSNSEADVSQKENLPEDSELSSLGKVDESDGEIVDDDEEIRRKEKKRLKKKHRRQSKCEKENDCQGSRGHQKYQRSRSRSPVKKQDSHARKGTRPRSTESRDGSRSHSRKEAAHERGRSERKHRVHQRSRTHSGDKKPGTHTRSRSGSRDRKKRGSRTRSRSGSKERRKGKSVTRSRSNSRERREFGRSEGGGSHSRQRRNDRSSAHDVKPRSHRERRGSDRSPSREKQRSRSPSIVHDLREKIDKKKLLEIARKNAMNMMKQGNLPMAVGQDKLLSLKAGGKSVEELTDFCKQLSQKEALGECSSEDETKKDSEDPDQPFIHHPFQIKEKPGNIVMNIRNAVQLPVKTLQEKTAEQAKLRIQFPVSSGQQHRKTEEWIPVSPKQEQKPKAEAVVQQQQQQQQHHQQQQQQQQHHQQQQQQQQQSVQQEQAPPPEPQVFPIIPNAESLDIGAIVSQRLTAMRKLQENPNDLEAINKMYQAQKDMQAWAASKQQPGLFTGSTGAKVLSQAELAAGFQAWAKRDQLKDATPVNGGMGMYLLQKMGWKPGEGLGKNKKGTLEPLQLDIKMDKKGLVSQEELVFKHPQVIPQQPCHKDLTGKHPVSALVELCTKKKWGPPFFDLIYEDGPDHEKNFLFKVIVNGTEYKPALPSPSKKHAKAKAAIMCLQALGLMPKNM